MRSSPNRGLHLVKNNLGGDRAQAKIKASIFSAGEVVPETAIYAVAHADHLLPLAVTLRRGASFPACSACQAPVEFRYLRRAGRDDAARFHVVLHVLPVLEETAEQKQPRRYRLAG